MWWSIGQIDEDGKMNGVGRKVRIDVLSSGSEIYERYSFVEEGQFVNDQLDGFGRKFYFNNDSYYNRFGYGKWNGENGRDASNFRLEGHGRKFDYQLDGDGGFWSDDNLQNSMSRTD